ncbi:MAG: pyridoxal-phosphate dependent enzyme [Gemmatimonadales bacterium]
MPLTIARPSIETIRAARERIRGLAVRTPLLRVELDGGQIVWLKLENLQPIGSFKIRGAGSALGAADPASLGQGVVTASAGNMGQGVAWCARDLGIPCSVIVPDHAPATKLAALERLGARVVAVPFAEWWQVLETRRTDHADGFFVHPVSEPAVVAGNATIGLEIAEDLPEVATVLVPFGGGGLSCGIASALREIRPAARTIAVEPETAAPLTAAMRAGEPVETVYHPSFVDGAGGRSVLPAMWPLAREVLAGAESVTLEAVAGAVRHLAERVRVVAEGAGALGLAAAPRHRGNGGDLVCVVSGGNIDSTVLRTILAGELPS